MSLPKDLGEVDTLVADTGYFSEKNVIPAIFHARAEQGARRVAIDLYGMEYQANVCAKGRMR